MSGDLFFYNASTGAVAVGRVGDDGNFTNVTTGGGLSTDWDHIVPLGRDLFFYNASTGAVAVGRVSDDGNFTTVTTGGGLSTDWDHIVNI